MYQGSSDDERAAERSARSGSAERRFIGSLRTQLCLRVPVPPKRGFVAFAFFTAALAPVPPKRGFVADTRNGTCADAQLLSAGTSWYYDYNVGDPYRSGDLKCNNTNPQHFVPMHWCISALHNNTPPAYVLLGVQESDPDVLLLAREQLDGSGLPRAVRTDHLRPHGLHASPLVPSGSF